MQIIIPVPTRIDVTPIPYETIRRFAPGAMGNCEIVINLYAKQTKKEKIAIRMMSREASLPPFANTVDDSPPVLIGLFARSAFACLSME